MSNQSRKGIYELIEQRRLEQDRQHGGPRHDDAHSAGEWKSFITDHAERYLHAAYFEDDALALDKLIDIAALAVAAYEARARRMARV